MRERSVPVGGVAFAGYLAVVGLFLLPVLPQLGDFVIGRADAMQFLWGAWWMDQTLLVGKNPFFTDAIFVPIGSPLVFHSYAPLPSLGVAIADRLLPVEWAWNAVLVLALPLAGLSAFALCRHLSEDAPASWVGGLVFMLSPFVAGKLGAGWLNLIYAAVLPFFALALLRATEPGAPRRRQWLLALATWLVLLTSVVLTVFAVNLALAILALRAWQERAALGALVARCARVFVPAVILVAPYLVLVVYYAVHEEFPPTARSGETSFLPHLTDFVLPTAVTSPYSDTVRSWVGTEGYRFDAACYLGLLVLPMCVIGFVRARAHDWAWLFGALGLSFGILAVGPFLLVDGEFVQVLGRSVPLPFALFRELPLLGMVSQTGRYMALVYLAMAVGMTAFVVWLRARRAGSRHVAVAIVSLLVCVDFAFQPILMKLPEPIELSGPDATVLEPRGYVGETMYQQTLHGRPMVGGYLSRRPPKALAYYRDRPGVACLMPFMRPRVRCEADRVLPALHELGITDVLAGASDPRATLYREIGLVANTNHETTTVWAVPPPATGGVERGEAR